MKHMLRTLGCAVAALALGVAQPAVSQTVDHLMPRPQQVERATGSYTGSLASVRVNLVSASDLGTPDYRVEGFDNEGYRLTITPEGITVTAATATGVLRASQTLEQLRGESAVPVAAGADRTTWGTYPCCTITDWPAFKVRGWMHDIGRSYISIDELRREIDLLSRFKVNMFHWHLTDNQGFRFESLKHPDLNSLGFTRFEGKYYTQEECRQLEAYARERGVIIIPEIDMPGHSASFEPAMGCTMMSPEGRVILKDLLTELAAAFPQAPYLHLGADESGANPEFVREMSDHIHSLGRKAICWNRYGGARLVTPEEMGIDLTTNWATAGRLVPGIPNVDMRYFYTNHFDLFADVAGAYRSTIFDTPQGSEDVGGISVGIWNDRRVSDERQIVMQNNLYAVVMAMTERAWMGGGNDYIERGGAVLPTEGAEYEAFADWERRFLHYRYREGWLADEPIAYVRQSDVRWAISPAYSNGGDATQRFAPETTADLTTLPVELEAAGAGVWLNHIWAPIVAGVLGAGPQEHGQTRYAWTYVWSDMEQEVGAQIQFYDYSRSDYDLHPQDCHWDCMGSRVWLNDRELLPTWTWSDAGRNVTRHELEVELGNLNIPARQPLPVHLRAGWNKVLLKLPYVEVGLCRPNKWQWTFVLTDLTGKKAADGVVYSPRRIKSPLTPPRP